MASRLCALLVLFCSLLPAQYFPPSGNGGATWGLITGTLSAQTDLNTALNARVAGAATLTTTGRVIEVASSGTATQGSFATSDIARLSIANTFTAGAKQSFQASGTTAGMRLVGVTSDPSSPVAGDFWYRSDTGIPQYRGASSTWGIVGGANLLTTQYSIPVGGATSGTLAAPGTTACITSTGMGVGTCSPISKLDVNFNAVGTSDYAARGILTEFYGNSSSRKGTVYKVAEGTVSVPAAVTTSTYQPIAVTQFFDGTVWRTGAEIGGAVSAVTNNASVTSELRLSTGTVTGDSQAGNSTGLTTQMVILGSGTVGIGHNNTSPTGTLLVYNATATTGQTISSVRNGAGQAGVSSFRVTTGDTTNYARLGVIPTDGNITLVTERGGTASANQNLTLTPAGTGIVVTGATFKAGGYQSSDGSAGVTVTTCTSFKNGLCVAGT